MKKYLVIFLFLALFFLTPKITFAKLSCETGSQGFNSSTGQLQVCAGGFSSKSSLKAYSIQVRCVKEAGAALCGTTQPQIFSLAGVPDNQIAQATDGTFYTCQIIVGLNPKAEQIDIEILDSSGQTQCTFAGNTGLGNQEIDVTQSPLHGKCGDTAIDTAIGCIPYGDKNALVGFFLRWGIGIGGGIAFLLLLFGGFQIMTSRGDPNRLKAGQEIMTSAIAGLLLLIFSLVILRIIGFNILNISNFK